MRILKSAKKKGNGQYEEIGIGYLFTELQEYLGIGKDRMKKLQQAWGSKFRDMDLAEFMDFVDTVRVYRHYETQSKNLGHKVFKESFPFKKVEDFVDACKKNEQ